MASRATTDSGHLSFHVDALSKMVSRTSMASWPTRSPCPVSVLNIVRLLLSPSYSAAYLASSATGTVTLL
jgi:hypothetical protein